VWSDDARASPVKEITVDWKKCGHYQGHRFLVSVNLDFDLFDSVYHDSWTTVIFKVPTQARPLNVRT
jgi:hypothetical protein